MDEVLAEAIQGSVAATGSMPGGKLAFRQRRNRRFIIELSENTLLTVFVALCYKWSRFEQGLTILSYAWRYAVTKADLVNAIAEKAGLSKADAEKALKAFTGAVTKALKAGEKVSLVGFGTFSVGQRAARTGKNPQTGRQDQDCRCQDPEVQGRQGSEGRRQQEVSRIPAAALKGSGRIVRTR